MFYRQGGHHKSDDFGPVKLPTSDEVQIHTWRDATLKELSTLLQSIKPVEYAKPSVRFSFRMVYQAASGAFRVKTLGSVLNSSPGKDDTVTLDDIEFVIGDYMDVAVFDGPPPISGSYNIRGRGSTFNKRGRGGPSSASAAGGNWARDIDRRGRGRGSFRSGY